MKNFNKQHFIINKTYAKLTNSSLDALKFNYVKPHRFEKPLRI